MKKILSIFLCILMVFTYFSVGAYATSGNKNPAPIAETDSGDAYFDANYAKIGQKITAYIKNHEEEQFLYKWYIDNKPIDNLTGSYTPIWCDLEKMLTVKIFSSPDKMIAEKSIFISNLPVVYIETENRENIISKEVELKSTIKIQGNDQYNSPEILYNGNATIKGRGNFTWKDAKKPYKIKLDSKADLFGMGKNKHWVLLSNPYDQSKIKNYIAYNLARKMDLNYMDSVFVDLVLNGQSVGTYSLCEHVRIGNTRVDINDWDNIAEDAAKSIYKKNSDTITKEDRDKLIDIMTDDLSWTTSDTVIFKDVEYKISDYYKTPSINGGYLFEIVPGLTFSETYNVGFTVDKPEGASDDMKNYLADTLQTIKNGFTSNDFCTYKNDQKIRYTDLIDVDSFAKVFLINEIFRNKDYGTRSTYMYKDINGKIFSGPVWDLDLTADFDESTNYYNNWKTLQVDWIAKMCSDPYFLNEIYKIYWKYRNTIFQEIFAENGIINTAGASIAESAKHDDSLWQYDKDYDKSLRSLKQWFIYRFNWLDEQFSSLETLYNSMSRYFSNSKIKTSVTVVKDKGNLILNFGTKTPETACVYVDGVLYDTISVTSSTVSIPCPQSGDCLTVTGYNSESEIISSGFLQISNSATSIELVSAPTKTEYTQGEKIEFDGLVLKATFSDGTTKNVNPDSCYTYTKDNVGLESIFLNRVTDVAGDTVVALAYDKFTVKYPISVKHSTDINKVEELIKRIPFENFNRSYIEDIFKAKIAYDALDDSVKESVAGRSNLEKAMQYIEKEFVTENTGIIYSYVDGIILNNLPVRIVFVVKGNPMRLRIYDSQSNSTTITPSTKNCLSIKAVGDYTIWTCNLAAKDYTMYALPTLKTTSDPYTFNYNEYLEQRDKILSIDYYNSVFNGEQCKLDVQKGKNVSKIRITENGKTVVESDCNQTNLTSIAFTPDTIGTHVYDLEYYTGDQFVKANSFDLYVRKNYNKPSYVNGVKLSNVTINYKDTKTIVSEINADPDADYTVTWKTLDPETVSIDSSGKITGLKKGTATITCTVKDSYGNVVSDTATVTVEYSNLQWFIIIFLFGWLWY